MGDEMDSKTHKHEIISVAVSTNVRGFKTKVFDIITHGEDFVGMALDYLYQIARRGFRIAHVKKMWIW